MCVQTWTFGGEHSVIAELSVMSIDSISSREHGRGSARKREPESATLATANSAEAIGPPPQLLGWESGLISYLGIQFRGECVVMNKFVAGCGLTSVELRYRNLCLVFKKQIPERMA
jgi:hypothetical protein